MTDISITIIAFAMFYIPGFSRNLSYRNKPVWTAIVFFLPACLLAYFMNSVSIVFFQVALISSAILHVNSVKFKNYWPHKVALHLEKFIIFGVIVLILLLPLQEKSVVIYALVAFRILNNLKGYFPKSLFLGEKYILYTMLFISIVAMYFRDTL